MLLSVGEVNENKNHQVIVRAIAELPNTIKTRIQYFIAGQGPEMENIKSLTTDLNLDKQVHLLGFRDDVINLYKAADAFAFPSIREGLGLAAIEAMASGLPLITSRSGGIKDYSIDGVTGYSCDCSDVAGFAHAIAGLYIDKEFRIRCKANNALNSNKYDKSSVNEIMANVYESI